MGVDIADARPGQGVTLNKAQHLFSVGDRRLRQIPQQTKRQALPQTAQRQFADHERMDQNAGAFQQPHHRRLNAAQMFHPN